ncbi:MAG: Glutamine--fructose-6-phosphate aminotransferase (isomerizing) [Parcubacteria bacterium OLB19]|nr:MAG: Glutamine--fructose-6-phosphate aminotransferase (isomerizing) [Parcubacteria bacterium OLB19]
MCGIFGYVGSNRATPILINGLKALEYRGYDSAGIFVSDCGSVKAVGPVVNLESKIPQGMNGSTGIAHTRWATHGVPSEANAHPHHDKSESIWLVHNGIIENYNELKSEMQAKGINFYSETDTEVLAKLIGTYFDGDLKQAVLSALKQVRGTYGVAVMHDQDASQVVVARMGSPIVIGVGYDGNYISSDPSALLAYTKEVVYLEDGEVAVVTGSACEVESIKGDKIEKTTEIIDWDHTAIQKNGYAHFMLKEIFEAPKVIEDTIRGRVSANGSVKLGGVEAVLPKLKDLERLQIVGCGSAFYAGSVGKYMLKEYANLPVEVELASEYRYTKQIFDKNTALLAVTQSGETADTLASLRLGKEHKVLTLGVVNAVGSTIARETDAGVYNHAGPEIAVASTKAFISQLTVFALLTLLLGKERGVLNEKESRDIAESIVNLPKVLKSVLDESAFIEEVAKKYAKYDNMMLIGRKLHAPIASEGALKIKEVSYIHAEGYAGGELKHGPIALLHDGLPVIALLPQDDVYEKMYSNVEEVKARRAPVLAIANIGDEKIGKLADDVIFTPKTHPILQPIVTSVVLQLLSYYTGVGKGYDVDRPRNLAKSVTVE